MSYTTVFETVVCLNRTQLKDNERERSGQLWAVGPFLFFIGIFLLSWKEMKERSRNLYRNELSKDKQLSMKRNIILFTKTLEYGYAQTFRI